MELLSIVIDIALFILAVAGIWAAIEIALTIRSARGKVTELADNLNETLAEVNPVLAKVDGVLDELAPSMKQVDPLMVSTIGAIDNLSKDLDSLEGILVDVNRLTSGVANVGEAASSASNAVSNGVNGLLSRALQRVTSGRSDSPKIASRGADEPAADPAEIAEAATAPEEPAKSEAEAAEKADAGYFKYPAGE